jgi:hypothetical protein
MVMSLQEGQTVLHLAATAGRTETVEALLDRGCDPNIQDFVSHSIFFCFILKYTIILGREESVFICTLPLLPFFCCLLRDLDFILNVLYINSKVLKTYPFTHSAGIFKQSIGAKNRVGIRCCSGPPGCTGWLN